MNPRRKLRAGVLVILSLMTFSSGTSLAASHRPRFGFQHFGARYTGGYSVVSAENSAAGPARISIRAARDGRSATVTWTNTFYTSHGSYQVALRWTFLPDGTVVANSLDPRLSLPATGGDFTLDGNRPIAFSAWSSAVQVSGQLRLIGGGALSITATLSGLPEGDVTYGFSGGRQR